MARFKLDTEVKIRLVELIAQATMPMSVIVCGGNVYSLN